MPFDPLWPPTGAALVSAPLRNQFTSLKALFDAQAATIATLQAQVAALQTQAAGLQAQINDRATTTDLNNAIGGTANNVNGVGDLGGLSVSDPVTQGEGQAIADKLSELVNSLHQ